MAYIQLTVLAPGRRQGMWNMPDDWTVGQLIPYLVQQMGLPTEVNWQLVSTKTAKPLPVDGTLVQARISQGTALKLEPVRNKLLQMFLDKLYDEIEGNVQDELWDRALAKLEELHEYDPRFPDPKGLRQLAERGITPSKIPKAGISWGIVLGGVAVAGVLAVGATVAALGGGYLLYRAARQEMQPPVYVTTEPGGGGVQPHTGDVQVTLEWYTTADLDLHVIGPDGVEIYFQNQQSPSGGELDVDANAPCDLAIPSPLENVYWPWGGAPPGQYAVSVAYYGECYDEGTADYQVTVRVDGEVLGVYPGTLSPYESVQITTFSR